MGQALYRKHRPKKLSEVVGQDHITQTLERALKSDKISHAYLFTGPKGTGKTSIARILAHEINQLPYSDESIHLDIIEIDAASNRRIDEIRDLKERIHTAPTSAKYKVYIIDEVHMLTREAFNALLKTLEEPPAHVVFILATTEAHKLPETIISRTQRFGFRPIESDDVTKHLAELAKSEGISITTEALELIADYGSGSFRDSIALLDQLRNTAANITPDEVRQALGLAPQTLVNTIMQAVATSNAKELSNTLEQAYEQAIQPVQLAHQLSAALRQRFVERPDPATAQLLGELQSVHGAHNPRIALDIVLFSSIAVPQTTSLPQATPPEGKPAVVPEPAAEPTPVKTVLSKTPSDKPKPAKHEEQETEHSKQPTTNQDTTESTDPPTPGDWQDILGAIRGKHNTLYGIIRMAEPEFTSGEIVLGFKFPFHHKRVSEARYIDILNKFARDVVGHNIRVSCKIIKSDTVSTPQEPTKANEAPQPDLSALTDVFGEGVSVDEQ
jgi:DNA polymerase-3 subunit gamma/tau